MKKIIHFDVTNHIELDIPEGADYKEVFFNFLRADIGAKKIKELIKEAIPNGEINPFDVDDA